MMRRAALWLLLAACDPLTDPLSLEESITIESPRGDAVLLGARMFAVELDVRCASPGILRVTLDDEPAGFWLPDQYLPGPCDQTSARYCVNVDASVALAKGRFWPARLQAAMDCNGNRPLVYSEPISVHVLPFDGVSFVPAPAHELVAAADGDVLAVSTQGLHRVDGTTGEVATLDHLSTPAAHAFAIGDDVYYHAPCADPLLCAAGTPDLFRVSAASLAPTGDAVALGCTPLAIAAAAQGGGRLLVLGDCPQPRVRWSAADLTGAVEAPLSLVPTGPAARRGEELAILALDGDELVVVAARDAPPLERRPTGVRATAPRTAISDDGERAALLDGATGAWTQVDAGTGAVVATGALVPSEATGFAYFPGTHRLLVADRARAWSQEGAQDPVLFLDSDRRLERVTPLDARRSLVEAADTEGSRSVAVHDGESLLEPLPLGMDWVAGPPPVLTADGTLHLAYGTAEGPLVARQLAPRRKRTGRGP